MKTSNSPVPSGYSPVPAGKLANMVTCLEMRQQAPIRPVAAPGDLTVERWRTPSVSDYRQLYRDVGQEWLWASRLVMPDEELESLLQDPLIEIFVLTDGSRRLGLLELDFRESGECELAFFGLVEDAIGQGAGRLLMNSAIEQAWSRPVERFWVHTCNFDHPAALSFYQRSGFRPYAFMVEVCDDPRLDGSLPKSAAPHVPLIEPV